MIPLISLEEHYFSPHIPDIESLGYGEQFKYLPGVYDRLLDIGPLRLASMDENHISMQILSHGPGLGGSPASVCAAANDHLAAAIAQPSNAGRFAGFAVLPMHDPDAAALELKRCVRELGFKGALVDSHVGGRHYEGAAYRAFWGQVASEDVPVYLHPTWPAKGVHTPLYGGEISEGAMASLGSSGWGWHADVAVHILKLHASSLFDTYPTLKIIAGHFGEMLPYMLERIQALSIRWKTPAIPSTARPPVPTDTPNAPSPPATMTPGSRRDFLTVYRENIYVTTSGCWSLAPMACLLRNTPVEHILFSVDYPFASNESGAQFMEELEGSGLVTKEQFEMIGYKNAAKLLGVKALV